MRLNIKLIKEVKIKIKVRKLKKIIGKVKIRKAKLKRIWLLYKYFNGS